jgi:hypothetical protein
VRVGRTASRRKKGRSSLLRPRASPVMMVAPIVVAPIAVARVVGVSGVTAIVIRLPPTAAIRAADPTHLLDLRSRVCLDWCDWHCGCGGRCKATAKYSGGNHQLCFAHGFLRSCTLNARRCRKFRAGLVRLTEHLFRQAKCWCNFAADWSLKTSRR